jgi:hypothetical protein
MNGRVGLVYLIHQFSSQSIMINMRWNVIAIKLLPSTKLEQREKVRFHPSSHQLPTSL